MTTIEEKTRRYDEAIERAKNFIENGDEREKTIAESIFAGIMEESEDEKLRKMLIKFIKGSHSATFPWGGFGREQILAWLEKQGQHINFLSKIQVGDKVTRNEDGVLVNLSQLNRVAKPAEKQGEPIGDTDTKEVDLESEIERIRKHHYINGDFEKAEINGRTITNIAKHFFELGLKVQKGEEI